MLALALSLAWPGCAWAQTSGTRTSSFAYDAGSGLLTQEVIEPGTPALRLQTDYTYNAFGQKTQVTVSGVDIATRSASTTYDAQGQFASQRHQRARARARAGCTMRASGCRPAIPAPTG